MNVWFTHFQLTLMFSMYLTLRKDSDRQSTTSTFHRSTYTAGHSCIQPEGQVYPGKTFEFLDTTLHDNSAVKLGSLSKSTTTPHRIVHRQISDPSRGRQTCPTIEETRSRYQLPPRNAPEPRKYSTQK